MTRRRAVLTVADTGIGIAPEMLPRVFDLFVQGPRTAERRRGGLGIGLTLAHRLAEAHGGTIHAASEGVGLGTTLVVRLPRIAPPPLSADPDRASSAGAPPSRRVLIVEDNDDGREMLRMALTLAGHEVHQAADGPAALEIAASLAPDVAVLDIGLPGIDGYELARRLRAGRHGGSIALIALTGYGRPSDRQRAMDAGFDAHLTKPIVPERLIAVIEENARARAPQP